MKIKALRTYHVQCALEQPFGFSQWMYDKRNVLIVEVVTDSGLSGWGECYGPAEVIQSAVDKFYGPRLIGQDASGIDAIWHYMWRVSLDFARGGVMMAAMSGIDMALWDLAGKSLNVSISQLMGGRLRDRVPCYATGMYYKDMPEEELLPLLLEEARGYVDEGYKALKIKVGKNLPFDERLAIAIRDAQPDVFLAADSNHAYDLPEAVRMARLLGDLDYLFFEEPLSPNDFDGFEYLQAHSPIAIATGECEQTRWGAEKLLRTRGVQLLQSDLAYCGGPSEALKMRAIASAANVNMIPHVWGTQLNLAAATHFLATSYHEPGRAEEKELFLECDRTENPLRDELYTVSVLIEDGSAVVPRGPGLGVEIDPLALSHFTVNSTECV